jgi:hypothetical protein
MQDKVHGDHTLLLFSMCYFGLPDTRGTDLAEAASISPLLPVWWLKPRRLKYLGLAYLHELEKTWG